MDDEWLWLEDIDSAEAMAWVRQRNAETLARFTADESFPGFAAELRQVLDSQQRIPYPGWRGDGYYYNFWRDADHPRGLWRRTTLDQYRRAEPDWDVLLDVDKLAAEEGENWVWEGARVRRPDYRRCLIRLSRGGADAVVVREYDLVERRFVVDGFTLPEAKSAVSWIDEDHIFVGTDEGPGSLTTSGYPRVVKRWQRGTPLAEAEVVFAGEPTDVSVHAYHDPTPGYERDFVVRLRDFFHQERYLLTPGGELRPIPAPADARWSVHRDWLLLRLRSEWEVEGQRFPAGSLVAIRFDDFMAGDRRFEVLFTPDGRSALRYYEWTRNHLLLGLVTDVVSRLWVLTPGRDGWRREELPGGEGYDRREVIETDPDRGDEFLVTTTGYLRPSTLHLGEVGGPLIPLKQDPTHFDATGLVVRQFFAHSADGTRVPYFLVGPERQTPGPVLLTAYGGFEHSLLPGYSGTLGRGWLAAGGTYAVANIRGGGEYGPQWHRAALREHRHRAYEDFVAVAEDLVTRGITTPAQLGIEGGSNGGLLMGVMLTRYPDRFGAVVAYVPLADMRRYHKLLAGASWMAEYGDPDVDSDWAFLREYSPYHNVRPGQPYPPVLLISSTRDDRVHPGHARKLAARLREHGYDEVWYYENIEGGHGAAADNAQAAFIAALKYTFLRRTLFRA